MKKLYGFMLVIVVVVGFSISALADPWPIPVEQSCIVTVPVVTPDEG